VTRDREIRTIALVLKLIERLDELAQRRVLSLVNARIQKGWAKKVKP
jgi:hypothetical protein